MTGTKRILLLGVLAIVVIGAFSMYQVGQWQKALLFRLGEIVNTDVQPGLHFKLPFINNVRKYDARILTLDVGAERFLTVEKKNVIVDSFVMWRIADVGRYYTAVLGDERHASQRLEQIIKDGMRGQFSRRTINDVVSGARDTMMVQLTKDANRQARAIGIEVVDVRVKRVDLPAEVSDSVYRRMQAERARVAQEFRSQGAEEAEKIRADADRQRQVLVADAFRDAEKIRGQGDARAAETYAKAYARDKDFYAFYRSLQSYKESFSQGNDVMLLQPNGEFFKYFNESEGQ